LEKLDDDDDDDDISRAWENNSENVRTSATESRSYELKQHSYSLMMTTHNY